MFRLRILVSDTGGFLANEAALNAVIGERRLVGTDDNE